MKRVDWLLIDWVYIDGLRYYRVLRRHDAFAVQCWINLSCACFLTIHRANIRVNYPLLAVSIYQVGCPLESFYLVVVILLLLLLLVTNISKGVPADRPSFATTMAPREITCQLGSYQYVEDVT